MSPEGLVNLQKEWVHSHEEDTPSGQVYRPRSFCFPPSRGRTCLELMPAGLLNQTRPAENDQLAAHRGQWILTADDELQVSISGAMRRFRIISLTPEKLILERLP